MRLHIGRVDVVYVNSLVSHRLAEPFHRSRLVLHVHELATVANRIGDPAEELVRRAECVLVPGPSAAVWVREHGVREERIKVIPGVVDDAVFHAPVGPEVGRLRHMLGIGDDVLVVSTVGWVGEEKGSDRFLDVAQRLGGHAQHPVRFLWVGGGSTSSAERRFMEAIADRGLGDVVSVLPAMEDLRPLYRLTDVLMLASREESLSLVALESAAQGTPVVYFPGSGGPDVLAEEGIVVTPPTPDVDGVVEAIVSMLSSTEERRAIAITGRRAVLEKHCVERGRYVLRDAFIGQPGSS